MVIVVTLDRDTPHTTNTNTTRDPRGREEEEEEKKKTSVEINRHEDVIFSLACIARNPSFSKSNERA